MQISEAQLQRLREVELDFHVRAFGEEMARINFLPLEERRRKVAEMVDFAAKKGYKSDKPAWGVTR